MTTSVYKMSVNSEENQKLLMQILKNHPMLENKPEMFQKFLNFYINEMHSNRFNFNNNLTTMNKEIIKRFMEMTKPIQKVIKTNNTAPPSKTFESRLKERQDNFLKLANPPKPKTIDFSDKIDEGELADMDNTMQQREQELREIMSDYKDASTAETWISSSKKMEQSNSDNIKITEKINEPIKTEILSTQQKHVTFMVDDSTVEEEISFLDKLKKKPVKKQMKSEELLKELIDLQKEILYVQKEILQQLKKIEKD